MKTPLACLSLVAALSWPGIASARPVTLTTTLKNYGGDGAYLALYVTDAAGAHVRTLWVAGPKTKYHRHLAEWSRASGGRPAGLDGVTGASVGSGRTLKVTADLADALFDAGYTLHVDATAEDMRDSPRDASVPLTKAGAGKPTPGKRYVGELTYQF